MMSYKRRKPFASEPKRRFKRRGARVPNQALRLSLKDEIKQVDLATANYIISNNTPIVQLLNGVALGSDVFNRIGRKFFMKSIQLRGSIRWTSNPTSPFEEYCRLAIVYDRQSNNLAPTYGDIFQTITSAGATSSTVESLPNEANKNRFLILKDFQYDMPGVVASGSSNDGGSNSMPTQVVNWFIPLKNMVTHYSGTSAAITDINTGSLFLVIFGRQNTVTNPVLQFTCSTRLRFIES